MAEFLTGQRLEEGITNVIFEAKEKLLIVSPFIKLDEYFKEIFSKHLNNPKLHLILIFGKNENQYGKSLSESDFEFFKQFPFVSIIYIKNLHGKYYGNERKGILTSINLYDFSFKNNVEFGVYSEVSLLDKIKPGFDSEIFGYCHQLAEDNPSVFIRRPIFEKKNFGYSESYLGSKILIDQTTSFLKNKALENYGINEYPEIIDSKLDFLNVKPSRIEFESTLEKTSVKSEIISSFSSFGKNPTKNESEELSIGFCIRTGIKIPFNPEKPFSSSAYKTWSQFEDSSYKEKYCHFSGEESNGNTSMGKPILRKNWAKAKEFLES